MTLTEVQNGSLQPKSSGLTQVEAHKRLAQCGYNELPEKIVNPFPKFLSYLWGSILWMIEAAAVLSAMVRDWTDLAIIIVLLVTNACVG